MSRDRDALGRPRNARPRDGLGRPLPRGSTSGVKRPPDDLNVPADEAIDLAQRYLDEGLPFHAHEMLEGLWKTQPAEERDLWQGLAQLAVGLTHALRGNAVGATALLTRGAERVGRYTGERHGIAVEQVLAESQAAIEAVAAGAGDVRPSAFRLRGV